MAPLPGLGPGYNVPSTAIFVPPAFSPSNSKQALAEKVDRVGVGDGSLKEPHQSLEARKREDGKLKKKKKLFI